MCFYIHKGKISAKFRLVLIIERWMEGRGEVIRRVLRSESSILYIKLGISYIFISILYSFDKVHFYLLDVYQSKKIETHLYYVFES